MFGSAILDVLIGLVTIFLLLSLTATAIREAFETVFKARAVMLERGIRELLDDRDGDGLARRLYEHPLVYGLYQGEFDPKTRRFRGGELPTYIPTRTFSAALLDIALRGQHAGPYAVEHTDPILTVDELRLAIRRLPSSRVQRALITAIDDARGDFDRVRANVESWFDASMDRVSGWYKRRTQLWLFVIGLGLATALNVNTITIANHLWADKAARDALVRRAELIGADSTIRGAMRDTSHATAEARASMALDDLESLNLPIGWDHLPPRGPGTGRFDYLMQIIMGILVTALAITLGAPFWFDTLNKIMVIRSTVKPHEKSPEEDSQDRSSSRSMQLNVSGPPPMPASGAPSAPPSSLPTTTPPPTPPVVPVAAFTPHTWANGQPDEGIL